MVRSIWQNYFYAMQGQEKEAEEAAAAAEGTTDADGVAQVRVGGQCSRGRALRCAPWMLGLAAWVVGCVTPCCLLASTAPLLPPPKGG
jgi:hypothetical protein